MILPRRISLANCLAGNTTGIQLRQRQHELAAAEAIGMTTDKGTMNALYLRDLAQKTRRGLEGRVRQGRSAGGIVYGYDIVRELDPSGSPFAVAERSTKQRIFTEFANGKSPATIARQLNAESIPGSNGRPWQGGTISGDNRRRTGISRNETYVTLLPESARPDLLRPGRSLPFLQTVGNLPPELVIDDAKLGYLLHDPLCCCERDNSQHHDAPQHATCNSGPAPPPSATEDYPNRAPSDPDH